MSYDDVVGCVRGELIWNTCRFFVDDNAELFDHLVRFDGDNLPTWYLFQCKMSRTQEILILACNICFPISHQLAGFDDLSIAKFLYRHARAIQQPFLRYVYVEGLL